MDETSQPLELLLSVRRDGTQTLGAQIEDQVRGAIRDGVLRAGAQVPSTRDLARQLGVSRRIAVDAYAQLAAEGYLTLRQGARPRVSDSATTADPTAPPEVALAPAAPRYDFRPSVPDVSTFPRSAWLRSLREAVTEISDADLGYGDVIGIEPLREVLADYLGRVRGVIADPSRVVVTSGYSQGLGIACHALAGLGAKRIAIEDPSGPEERLIAARAGLEAVPVRVDELGMRVDDLAAARVDAVVLTPGHQHPTGVVLAGERRTALRAWLRDSGAIAIEDDYDAEYRYDRAAVGALQGLEPEHVIYAGTVSKTLAPALRLGWLVVPPALVDPVRQEKMLADRGSARIEQYAFADFLGRGELDRHLRRMRVRYRSRRDALLETVADELPDATVRGIAAGLHAIVELPPGDHEQAIVEAARARRIEIETLHEFLFEERGQPPTLMLGYAQMPEPTIRAGIRELAEAVRAARGDASRAG
jgi:GntR family transcriptional regulator / MocR family aminotransferase